MRAADACRGLGWRCWVRGFDKPREDGDELTDGGKKYFGEGVGARTGASPNRRAKHGPERRFRAGSRGHKGLLRAGGGAMSRRVAKPPAQGIRWLVSRHIQGLVELALRGAPFRSRNQRSSATRRGARERLGVFGPEVRVSNGESEDKDGG